MELKITKKAVFLFLLLTVGTGFSQDLMYGDLIFNQAVNIYQESKESFYL